MLVIAVDKNDLSFKYTYEAESPDPGRDSNCFHLESPSDQDINTLKAQASGESAILVVDSNKLAAKTAAAWANLRATRNNLLGQSDWTQSSDSPLASEVKTSWATYRQALRDLPANTEDPSNPTWPTKP